MYSDGDRTVRTVGEPTAGGAYAEYEVISEDEYGERELGTIKFQNDTIPNVGVVGWTNEALLAIVADRLNSFQQSDFACDENQEAFDATQKALGALERRTAERKSRGVEGTHKV